MANIQIPTITENGQTILATSGKYCDRNIEINVEVEGSGEGGGGAYDITSTTNADGTQSLAIVDAGSGSGSAVKTSNVTIQNDTSGTVWLEYGNSAQEWVDTASVTSGSSVVFPVIQGSLMIIWPPYDGAFGQASGVYTDCFDGVAQVPTFTSVYFRVTGDGRVRVYEYQGG